MSFRRRWSSRTSSRIGSGSCSRCHWHSRRPAASPSPCTAAARTALIAYAAAPSSCAATWATAPACPAAYAAYRAAPCGAGGTHGVATGRTSLHHRQFAPHPGDSRGDRITRSWIARLGRFEQGQDVLCARGGPQREEMVVLVGEGSPAANCHEPRIANLREDHRLPAGIGCVCTSAPGCTEFCMAITVTRSERGRQAADRRTGSLGDATPRGRGSSKEACPRNGVDELLGGGLARCGNRDACRAAGSAVLDRRGDEGPLPAEARMISAGSAKVGDGAHLRKDRLLGFEPHDRS